MILEKVEIEDAPPSKQSSGGFDSREHLFGFIFVMLSKHRIVVVTPTLMLLITLDTLSTKLRK